MVASSPRLLLHSYRVLYTIAESVPDRSVAHKMHHIRHSGFDRRSVDTRSGRSSLGTAVGWQPLLEAVCKRLGLVLKACSLAHK